MDGLDRLLSTAFDAHLAQISVRQNEDMRKISAWVGLVAVPTLIAGIYGMNFQHMPELGWGSATRSRSLLMVVICGGAVDRGSSAPAGSDAGTVRSRDITPVASSTISRTPERDPVGHEPRDRVVGDEPQQPGDRRVGDDERHDGADDGLADADRAAERRP